MKMSARNHWEIRIVTFVLWAALFGSIAFWSLRFTEPAVAPTPAGAAAVQKTDGVVAVAQLMGGAAPASSTTEPIERADSSAMQLVGILAGTQSGQGAALISVHGQPAKPYRVGQQVADGWILQSVRTREATLSADENGSTVQRHLAMPVFTASKAPAGATPGRPGVLPSSNPAIRPSSAALPGATYAPPRSLP